MSIWENFVLIFLQLNKVWISRNCFHRYAKDAVPDQTPPYKTASDLGPHLLHIGENNFGKSKLYFIVKYFITKLYQIDIFNLAQKDLSTADVVNVLIVFQTQQGILLL